MLTIIYKLIATILSNRLNPVNKDLISPQQTGFILGRSILKNISLAWMTIERVTKNQLPSLLTLLHSEKAFDGVEHPYIWAMLEKLDWTWWHLPQTGARAPCTSYLKITCKWPIYGTNPTYYGVK